MTANEAIRSLQTSFPGSLVVGIEHCPSINGLTPCAAVIPEAALVQMKEQAALLHPSMGYAVFVGNNGCFVSRLYGANHAQQIQEIDSGHLDFPAEVIAWNNGSVQLRWNQLDTEPGEDSVLTTPFSLL